MVSIKLLREDDKEQFILDNQEAFNYGALEKFGLRDSHFEEGGKTYPGERLNSQWKQE